MYLYRIEKKGKIDKIIEHNIGKEEEIQKLIITHLYELFQINPIKEFHKITGHGEIDALGLDDDFRPVIIEFKKRNEKNVISQVLDYAHWLEHYNDEFGQLASKETPNLFKKDDLGEVKSPSDIDFNNYRIVIIAQDFTTRQIHAAETARPNIELVDYTVFKYESETILGLEYLSKEPSFTVEDFGIDHYFKNKNRKLRKIFDKIDKKLKEKLPEDSVELYTKNKKNIAYKTGRRRFIKIRPMSEKLVIGFYLGDKYHDFISEYEDYASVLRRHQSGWVYYDAYDESYIDKPIVNELISSSFEYSS